MPSERVVQISGSLDLTTAGHWGETLRAAGSDGTAVVVDARNLEFIDSTGVGELLNCARDLQQSGATLQLRGVSPEILELLEVLGVSELLGLD